MKRFLALLLGLLPVACTQSAVTPHPRYVLGAPYHADGVWHYPRRRLNAVVTGLASIVPPGHPPLTADGEAFSEQALAAASPDLQLPAIARLTNLVNGRQLEVRINDRGPADPGRVVGLTRRVARLLGVPAAGGTPVRLRVLAGPSQIAEAALPGAPRLAMTAAPVGVVLATSLGPPGGAVAQGAGGRIVVAPDPGGAPASSSAPAVGTGRIVPALSGRVGQVAVPPEALWVRLGRFSEAQYAAVLAARLAGLHPGIRRAMVDGQERFIVRIGPFAPGSAGVAAADAMLRRALGAGIGDARIVIDQE